MNHFYHTIEGMTTGSMTDLYREVVKRFPSGSTFVEVGTWMGQSASFMAVEIINSEKDIAFYCVDSGLGRVGAGEGELTSILGRPLFDIFTENMEPVREYYIPIWTSSIEASKKFNDRTLDFVFLDADHAYEHTKDDIVHWLPKIRVGGVLAGHDYRTSFPGVDRVVGELLPSARLYGLDCFWYEIK